MRLIVKSLVLFGCSFFLLHQAPANPVPVPICQASDADPDGDSWGFEHNRSCRVVAICTDLDGDGWGWDGQQSCDMAEFYAKYEVLTCRDDDGDGWGWDGYRSCRMKNADSPAITSKNSVDSCLDVDGDGWGWDGARTCVADEAGKQDPALSKVIDEGQCQKIQSGDSPMSHLVTDVILTAGQSNAAGNKTVFDVNHPLDQINSRILAWTSEQRWEVADPTSQVWDSNRFPKRPGQEGFNHPAFQIARSIVQHDGCRVVAIIASAASGEPISHWIDNVDSHFSSTSSKVTKALAALPYKSKVDMIWWMQGESDNHPNVDTYYGQLKSLIGRYRSQAWFDASRYFLANETGWFGYANKSIRLLASDTDVNTNYSANPVGLYPDETLHIVSEGATVHFNETALRIIGDLVRDEYLFDYRARVSN